MTATIFLSIACPALGLFAGYYCLSERTFDWRSAALCLALFMGGLAYGYVPGESSDLVRYMEYVIMLGDMPLSDALLSGIHGEEGLWGFSAICWVIGKIGEPHILPFLSVFTVYYVGLYVTGRIGESLEVREEQIATYMFFILVASNFYAIVNNIRNVLAFSIIGLAVFREIYDEKKDPITLALYLLPLTIHSSAAAILICRLLVPITSRVKLVGLALCVYIKQLIGFVDSITSKLPRSNSVLEIVQTTVHKAYRYFYEDDSTWGNAVANSGSRKVWKILYIALAFIICFIAYYCSNYIKKRKSEFDADRFAKPIFMMDFAFLLGLMTIACLPMRMPEYWRFAAVMILFASPIYYIYNMVEKMKTEGESERVISVTFDMLKKAVVAIVIGLFLLWVRGISNSDLFSFFTQPILSSPIVVLFKSLFERIAFYL